jgi:hypothetical protein
VKKARKAAPKKTANPRKRLHKFSLDLEVPGVMSPEEAATFDVPRPPPGFAYQWAAVTAIFGMELKGWTRVPFSRHPEMGKAHNFDGYIVHRDMTLFQMASELVEARLAHERKKAEWQGVNSSEAVALLSQQQKRLRSAADSFILSPSFIATEAYPRPDAGPSIIDLTIKFTMPWRWRDAAAALKLDESEYVRRRLLMQGTLLAADVDGTYFTVKLSTEKSED